jgi:hypothetical protein
MQFKSLNILSDFMQVLYSTREYYTANEYFSKYILFIVIYLLLD